MVSAVLCEATPGPRVPVWTTNSDPGQKHPRLRSIDLLG